MDKSRIPRRDRRFLAGQLGVTLRTLELWADPKRPPSTRPCGRPPASVASRRAAQRLVRRELVRQGKSVGWRKVAPVLLGQVPTRLVQECVARWKKHWRARERKREIRQRLHVEVLAKDVLWAQDATHVGRVDGRPVLTEVVREVATTRIVGLQVGAPACACDVQQLLRSVGEERGRLPLVHSLDNGGPYRSREFLRWLRNERVIVLRNIPHVPQHNAFAERANGELKAETGLRSARVLSHAGEARALLQEATDRLNHAHPRSSRGGRTAAQLDQILPAAENLVPRDLFWRTTRTSIARALRAAPTPRARLLARRTAILDNLESFGLIRRTRGGVPLHALKCEDES
jgi:transposase InsO family protein